MKHGIWVVVLSSVFDVHIKYLICIFFWLASNNKVRYLEFYMGYSNETWYVGGSALKYYLNVLLLLICIIGTAFAYSPKVAHAVYSLNIVRA